MRGIPAVAAVAAAAAAAMVGCASPGATARPGPARTPVPVTGTLSGSLGTGRSGMPVLDPLWHSCRSVLARGTGPVRGSAGQAGPACRDRR